MKIRQKHLSIEDQMKTRKIISYSLLVGLMLGSAVSAVQAAPGPLKKVLLWLRSRLDQERARRFDGLSGDALLEVLFNKHALRELLNADVPSDDGLYWSWEAAPCEKEVVCFSTGEW